MSETIGRPVYFIDLYYSIREGVKKSISIVLRPDFRKDLKKMFIILKTELEKKIITKLGKGLWMMMFGG